ncbi:MAG: YfiM family lipoprotein [Escherichia coli]|nr:YfiM family lipoprotein [Escherichia coli]
MRILFVCSLLLLSGCSHMANDSWSGQDKAQHFIASAMLSAAGNEYSQHQGMSRDRSAMFGLMFSVSWDVAGASTGYTVWQLTRH